MSNEIITELNCSGSCESLERSSFTWKYQLLWFIFSGFDTNLRYLYLISCLNMCKTNFIVLEMSLPFLKLTLNFWFNLYFIFLFLVIIRIVTRSRLQEICCFVVINFVQNGLDNFFNIGYLFQLLFSFLNFLYRFEIQGWNFSELLEVLGFEVEIS